jgi:transcriptional regulator with XRE-family HTH domain
MDNKEIGSRIKSKREEKHLTLQEVAENVGVAKSTIQRYEAGTIENIKIPVIASIARVLDVNPSWLMGKSDSPETKTTSSGYELKDTYFSFAKEMQEKNVSEEDMQKLWQFYEMIKKM